MMLRDDPLHLHTRACETEPPHVLLKKPGKYTPKPWLRSLPSCWTPTWPEGMRLGELTHRPTPYTCGP